MAHSILIPSMLAIAAAQTTTLQVPFYGYDTFPIDASVISVQDSVTTLTLACPSDADECGLFPAQTLTYGPSTYRMDTGAGEAFTGYQICQASVCTESAGGSEANFPGSSTTTYDSVETMPVTITGGVDMLSGAGGGGGGGGTGSGSATPSATTGESASTTTASVTELTGTAMTSTGTDSASRTSSAAAETSSGAASASHTEMMLGSGLVAGVVAFLVTLV